MLLVTYVNRFVDIHTARIVENEFGNDREYLLCIRRPTITDPVYRRIMVNSSR
jgi:hypothetical protein